MQMNQVSDYMYEHVSDTAEKNLKTLKTKKSHQRDSPILQIQMAAPKGIRLQVIMPPNDVQRACTVIGGSVALGDALVRRWPD